MHYLGLLPLALLAAPLGAGEPSPRAIVEQTGQTAGGEGWLYPGSLMLTAPRWLQAREVTLFYNGVRANTVYWREVRVGSAIDPSLFSPPEEAKP